MKKISAVGSNGILIKFLIKSLLSSAISIILFSFISSKILVKTDADLTLIPIISAVIIAFSSLITAAVSVTGIKNNGGLMGVVSILPLVIFSFINLIIFNNTFVMFLIKLVIMIAVAFFTGSFVVKKSRRIKV